MQCLVKLMMSCTEAHINASPLQVSGTEMPVHFKSLELRLAFQQTNSAQVELNSHIESIWIYKN